MEVEADGWCIEVLEVYLSKLHYHGEQLGFERGSRNVSGRL